MKDLLGYPLSLPDVPPRRRSQILYELGDAAEPGSDERAALYRQAAAAQRQADASADLTARIKGARQVARRASRARYSRQGMGAQA